jgi:hypothetical protein
LTTHSPSSTFLVNKLKGVYFSYTWASHKVLAWHPFAGRIEMEVDVPKGGNVQIKIKLKK